jgi:hypothetical protein
VRDAVKKRSERRGVTAAGVIGQSRAVAVALPSEWLERRHLALRLAHTFFPLLDQRRLSPFRLFSNYFHYPSCINILLLAVPAVSPDLWNRRAVFNIVR